MLVVPYRRPAGRRPRFEALPAGQETGLGLCAPATGPRTQALARHAPFVLVLPRPARAEATQIESETRGA